MAQLSAELMAEVLLATLDSKQAEFRVMGMYWGGKQWFLLAMGSTRDEAERFAELHERDIRRKGLGVVQFRRLERRHGDEWFFCAGR